MCDVCCGVAQVWRYRLGGAVPLEHQNVLPEGTAITVHAVSACGSTLLTGGTRGVVQVMQLDADPSTNASSSSTPTSK